METESSFNFACMSIYPSIGTGFTAVLEHEQEMCRNGILLLKLDTESFTTTTRKIIGTSAWSELAELNARMKATDSSELVFCCSLLIGLGNLLTKTPNLDAVKEESDIS